MLVKVALLADHANMSAEGKLNILGVFDHIRVASLPAVHPQMHFVLRLEARPSETNRSHRIEIRLHDPAGQMVFDLSGDVAPRAASRTITSNQILALNNLPLEKDGQYTFAVFVDGDLKAEVPLNVEAAPSPPALDSLPQA